MKDLAEAVGVSISLISKDGNNKLLPPLAALHALVTAPGTYIGALFLTNFTGVGHVARAGSWPRIAANSDGTPVDVTLERLVPSGYGHPLQSNIYIVATGGGGMGTCAMKATSSVVLSVQGRLVLGIDGIVHELGPSASFALPPTPAHSYHNPGNEVTGVLWIDTTPTN